jgi:zinc transporter
MSTESGLIHAFVLDGKGSGTRVDWAGIAAWQPSDGVLWVHLDYALADAAAWIDGKSGIDRLMIEAMLDHDPRPRAVAHGEGLLLIIRGINLNQGAEPEDMISIRTWFERDRVITMRHRVSRSLKTLAAEVEQRKGPKDAADFVVQLCDRVIDGVVVRVDNLSDAIAALEDQVLTDETAQSDLRARIADHRRRAIALRRFLGPQRDALAKLGVISLPWFDASRRDAIGEETDRMARTLEELDAARDRASVTQEELQSRLAEMSNKRLYVLSLITAVFLPLGFVCALLGVNVGGIPFRDDDWAFWALCGCFVVGLAVQWWIFKKRGWL